MNKYTIFFVVLIMSLSVSSQIIYTSNNLGNAGYSLKLTTVNSGMSGFDFSLTGASYSWDYSTLGRDFNQQEEILNPDNTGYKVPFITQCTFSSGNPFACNTSWNNLTDIAFLELDSLVTPILTVYDVTALSSINSNVLVTNIQGAKAADSGNVVVPITSEYIDKDTVYAFPLNYLNQHTSKAKWQVDLNSIGRDIALKVSYTRSYEVEGWGSITTPYKIHSNVLKVKTVIDEIDSVRYQTFSFGIPRKTVKYTWFDPAYGMPIMEATGQIDIFNSETITQVKYLDSTTVAGIKEHDIKEFKLYPNPASDFINIAEVGYDFTQINFYSVSGKLVKEYKAVNNSNKINISYLNKGSYIVKFYNQKELVGISRLIKE